jgi:hypothetical protein
MRSIWSLFLLFAMLFPAAGPVLAGGGITPEQIYQAKIDWDRVIGTWEALPDDDPLAETEKNSSKPSHPTLITLRKDGTCRVLSKERPLGSDGLWTASDHGMIINFPDTSRMELYVYGLTGEFMITQCPPETGKDQLWGRVR